MRRLATLALAVAALAGPGRAAAGPYSDVASALDPDDQLDIHLEVDYGLDIRRSAIRREAVGLPGTSPTDPIPVIDDLVFAGARHTVTPRLTVGLFHDIALALAVPVVVGDSRTLELDQRDTPCDFTGPDATCVNRDSSTTLLDGLLPMDGYDATNGGTGFSSSDPTVFKGANRRGVDQLHLGLVWAPMNQARDDTKPTWKLGAEGRLAIGKVATIDANDPGGTTGVGRGVHEVRLWTSVARRIGWAEPYVEAWWMAPFAIKDRSPFADPGFGARNSTPQQEGGVRFGFEAFAVDQGDEGARLSLELGARVVAHFEGRAYTEMWEVFALAGKRTGLDTGGPLVLDSDPLTPGVQAMNHPGVSSVENYLEAGGRVAARISVGQKFRIATSFEMTAENQHVISFADAGVDLPQCSGSVTSGCETTNDDLVTPGTVEVNPTHVQLIDLVGHRYRVQDVFNYVVGVDLQFLF